MRLGKYAFLPFVLVLSNACAQPSDTLRSKDSSLLLDDVVVSGTLNPVQTSRSPIFVESFRASFFRKNVSATLFESVGMINGVRPQLNCNVCNTGDIHINGMEGPYTMVLIDGMPIMSSLGSVYGLVGIPQSMVEKIEVVKGPASSIYGSEAMAGLINIITKTAASAPKLSAESNLSAWGESNTDLGFKFNRRRFYALTGINYFHYQVSIDRNKDGFTDIANQSRFSVFQKIGMDGKKWGSFNLGLRYVYEDRWGGETRWAPQWRGTDSIYGESIYTTRYEAVGKWRLPFKPDINLQFAYNSHNQNAAYGQTSLVANQQIGFAQLIYTKTQGLHQWLWGAGSRLQIYTDNSKVRLAQHDELLTTRTFLPGVFVQDELSLSSRHTLLGGYRLDYHPNHGFIHSPRIAFKMLGVHGNLLRIMAGTGFRVVNLFTEEHAALTGARNVVITEALKPEKSASFNVNFTHKKNRKNVFIKMDYAAFYTHFTNKILADYLSNPNEIRFSNLSGYGVCRGTSIQSDFVFSIPFRLSAGATFNDIYSINSLKNKIIQPLSPRFSGTINGGYTFIKPALVWDLSMQFYSPMHLPVLEKDFRAPKSPWFALLNTQISKKTKHNLEYYLGIKNLLNFIPKNPIMRPFDPFDKTANDPVNNPNGYTFDTTYNYAPLQGRRWMLGLRFSLN